VRAVDECFAQVELASLDEVVCQCLQRALQHTVLHPTLVASEACRVRRIAIGHVGPRCASAQDPNDAVEHVARIAPRSTATVVTHFRLGQQRLDCGPLLVGEVHLDLRSQSGSAVDRYLISR
jgi:hypothetical protein